MLRCTESGLLIWLSTIYRGRRNLAQELYQRVFVNCSYPGCQSRFFLITVGLCEGKSEEFLVWFLENLKEFLDLPSNRPVCLMSDKGKGILKVVPRVKPEASHRLVLIYVMYGKILDDVMNFIG